MKPYGSPPLEARRAAEAVVRYRKNFRAFCDEQLKIRGEPLRLWPCQEPLVQGLERQMKEQGFVRAVYLKARQVGCSTLAQAWVAWRTMLWPHVNAIVIADEAERSKTLFEISRTFYDHLDPGIRPMGRYITQRQLVFANPSPLTRATDPGLRSRIVIDSAHKKNIAIGSNWQVAHLSEVARFPDPSLVLDGVIPAVHRVADTAIIMESSAVQSGAWFRSFCEASMRGETAFEFSFVPWWSQPEYCACPVCGKTYPQPCLDPLHEEQGGKMFVDLSGDERHIMREFGLRLGHIRWMREKLAEMANDWDLFRQSYPLTPEDAWVTPGVQVFPPHKLREQRQNVLPPLRRAEVFAGPKILTQPHGRLLIWEEPQVGKAYDVGVDPSLGTGSDTATSDEHLDNAAVCVIERGTNKQVAEFASRAIVPQDLGTLLYWLGLYYNTAQVGVETNGIGSVTNNELAKIGYPNLFIWKYRDEVVPRYSRKIGWESNLRSKPWLVAFALHELMSSRVVIRSELLLKEMEMYARRSEHEWGAVAGHHDDRVTAWQIALIISDDENFGRYFNLRKATEQQDGAVSDKKIPEDWECDRTFKKGSQEREDAPWD